MIERKTGSLRAFQCFWENSKLRSRWTKSLCWCRLRAKIVSVPTPLPRGSRSDTTSESKTGTRYENCGEIRLPEPTSLLASLFVSGYSCFPPDKLGMCGVRDLSNAKDEGAEVQDKFDVELGRVRHRSRHLVSPSLKLRVPKNITCQLRPDVSTDTVSQILMMVDRLPITEATYAQREAAVADIHTTKMITLKLLMQVEIMERS